MYAVISSPLERAREARVPVPFPGMAERYVGSTCSLLLTPVRLRDVPRNW